MRTKALTLALLAAGAAVLSRGRREAHELAGQTVVITGGSRGLGFALAREFGRRGCRVAICARDGERLEEARRNLLQDGVEVFAQPCDVGEADDVESFLAATVARFGPVDILVNNAGIIQVGPLESLEPEDFEEARRTMFDGLLHTTLRVLPGMKERGSGHIVNITSIGGRLGVPHMLPYVTSKFAANGFSEALHAELAGTGVVVTTIVPGLMRTGSHLNAEFAGHVEGEARWFSLGATLPLISMRAERAARQIVDAVQHKDAVRTLGIAAMVGAAAHGLAPGLTNGVFSAVGQHVLPGRVASPTRVRGETALDDGRAIRTATTLGRTAARELLQYPIYPVARGKSNGR
jgi:short-subunit dehydrogenase